MIKYVKQWFQILFLLAWTVDNYADVGLLLSQCQNVYSAEVPTAMQVCKDLDQIAILCPALLTDLKLLLI